MIAVRCVFLFFDAHNQRLPASADCIIKGSLMLSEMSDPLN